jgi:hypothetical protein
LIKQVLQTRAIARSPPWFHQKKETASLLGGFLLVLFYFFLILFSYCLVAVQMFDYVHEPDNHVQKDGNNGGKQEEIQIVLNN